MEYNYSIDALKRSAFIDELNNVLKQHSPAINREMQIIIDYLKCRIKQIDDKYK